MRSFFKLLIPLVFVFSCAYELSIPESKIVSYVSKEFPKEKEVFLSKIVIRNPDLKLLGNNTGEFSFDLEIVPPFGKEVKVKVDTLGKFLFDSNTKTLYLVGLEPKEVSFNGKEIENAMVNKVVNVLIKDILKGIPVYKIEGKKANFVKEVEIKKGRLIVKLGV